MSAPLLEPCEEDEEVEGEDVDGDHTHAMLPTHTPWMTTVEDMSMVPTATPSSSLSPSLPIIENQSGLTLIPPPLNWSYFVLNLMFLTRVYPTFYIVFGQFPTLHFGLDHSGSRPFNYTSCLWQEVEPGDRLGVAT